MAVSTSSAFDWSIDNAEAFQKQIERLGKATSDFRIPFTSIMRDFHKSNRILFNLKGPGLYQDLSPQYKKVKEKRQGSAYPILVGQTGNLSKSVLGPKNLGSIATVRRQELLMGSSIGYGVYHNSDKPRNKMPLRKFIFIDGGPGDKSRSSGVNGRRERWTSIVDSHINQLLTGSL